MFKTIRIGTRQSSRLVVGVAGGDGSPSLPRGLKGATAKQRRALEAALEQPGFKAGAGEIAAVPDATVVGLGALDELDADTMRKVGAAVVRHLDRLEFTAARLHLAEAIPARTLAPDQIGRAVGEGMGLANWRVDFFDGSATKTKPARSGLTVGAPHDKFKAGLKDGLLLAEAANEARRIAATPPNMCNPTWMAKEARRLARAHGLQCRVITYQQAQQQGMGGIVNVGKGSASKPCMIILEHRPARARKGVKVALVGKTITYDTGGYSLKISNGMKGMKYDKNGGMAVIGTMLALSALKVPVHTVALLPCAENMVSDIAYRPDDIITMYNKVTVEVTNTDAEGRLVMADALAYACKKLKPTALIDIATLTGGVVVGLGHFCAGMWCEDDALRERLDAAAETTGEKLWRLPLWDAHRDFMRSKHADIWNSAPSRNAHPIQGAAFLSYFVDEDVPWAHLDIAGVNAVDRDTDLFVTGPTGFGVRLLAEMIGSYA